MQKKITKIISLILCFLLVFEQGGFAQTIPQLDISGYFNSLRGALTQDKFRPLHLRYLRYDSRNNNFRLLLDKGDLNDVKTPLIQETTQKLLEYFFVGVSLPNSSFWVNLRPDSPDNIIDPYLAQTDVGKILLEADLQLKKDTAKFTSPENPKGKEYWDKLYQKAGELFGYDNITIPTLTRPWIVPDEIIVREANDNAYIYKATLKVQLEQDHLQGSAVYNFDDPRLKELNEYSSQLIRELIIPELTKEVNISKRYASLKQVYYSLILSQWFKQKFSNKGGFYSTLIDRRNLNGITSKEDWSKTAYFKEYQKSFQKGEYNIQQPVSTPFGQTIRSYFSGGVDFGVAQPGQGRTIANAMQRGCVQASTPGDIFTSNSHILLVNVNKGGSLENMGVNREAIVVGKIENASSPINNQSTPLKTLTQQSFDYRKLQEIRNDEIEAVEKLIKEMVAKGYSEYEIRLIFNQHIKRLQQRESVDFTKSKWLGRLNESFDFWRNQRQYYDYRLVNIFGDQMGYPQDDYTTKTERNERLGRVTEQFRKIMEKDFQEKGAKFFLFSGGSGVGNSSMWNMLMAMEKGKYRNRFRKFVMHNSRERRPADQYKKDLIHNQMMPGLEHALEIILNNGVNGFDVRKTSIHNIGAYKDQLYKQINPNSELKEELNKILDLTSVGEQGKRIGLDSYGQALLRHPDYAVFIQKHQQYTNTEVVEPPYAHKEWTSTHLEISLVERIGKLKNGNYRIFGEFDGEAYYFLPQDLILELAARGEMATILFNGTDQQGVAISDIIKIINSKDEDAITVYETIPEFMKLVRTALDERGLGDKFKTAIVSSIKKIAVIGTDTERGRKVYEQLVAEGEHLIVGIGKGDGLVDLDITDENAVKTFISEAWPDVIVFPPDVDVGIFSKPFKKHYEGKNKYGGDFKFDIEMQFDGDFIPSVLIEDGYEILESPKRGGSSSQTFIAKDKNGKKVVIKYADWEGISGNGAPWLRKQKDKLMYIQRKYPLESRSLYPKVLSYRDEGEVFYYVMEYFEGAEDITQYFLNAEDLTPEQMYAEVNDIISRMVQTHYSHPSQAPFHVYEGEIEANCLNRALYRMKLLDMHKGSVYKKLLEPYKFQTVEDRRFEVEDFDDYPDISYFFDDLMRQKHIEINGRTYPNLPTLLKIFADNIDTIQRKLGPAHFSHYVHSDIALRNILRLPDGEIKLIDVRGVNVSPTSPSKVSIEYDLGKIAHSFLMEIARNDLYRMRAEKKDGQFSFSWEFDDIPGVQRYRYVWNRYREMLENNATLQALFRNEGDRSKWIDYVFLLESFNYLSDAIHRFSQDSTGKDPLIYYLYATMGLYKFLDGQGLLSSDQNELLTDGFKRNNSSVARGVTEKIVAELFSKTDLSVQIIGFSGPTGAGKTSYADSTRKYFQDQGRKAQVLSLDMFLTDRATRGGIIESIASGELEISKYQEKAWDMEGFDEMLRKIDEFKKSGKESLEIHIPNAYNRETGKRDKNVSVTITRDMVVIIEGVRIVNQKTEEYFDKTVMVDVDQDDILAKRLIDREQDKPEAKRLSPEYVQERFNAIDRENARLMRIIEGEYYDYLIDASNLENNVLYEREPRLVSPPLSVIKNQIIKIEENLGRLSPNQIEKKVRMILRSLRSGEVTTQGEEIDVLQTGSGNEVVVGQVDREIAERFGYIHRTANAIILTPDGKNIILTRRAHNKKQYPYYLTIPGGHVLSGQTYEEAMKDELLEELELDSLEGTLVEVGAYSYGFDDLTGKDTTKERRKLFIYRLTTDEYRRVLSRKEELQRMAKGKDGEQKLKAELEARQFQGVGEVWSYHLLSLDELKNASVMKDTGSPFGTTRFVTIEDIVTGKGILVPFTPDLLNHLVGDYSLMEEIGLQSNKLTMLGPTQEDLYNAKQEIIKKLLDTEELQAYENTIRLIKDLKDRNILIGVGTMSTNADMVLAKLGIRNSIRVLVDGNDVNNKNLPSKPSGEFYLEVARRLGVSSNRSVVVEDTVTGVESAVNGKFGYIIGLARNKGDDERLKAAGADIVLEDIGSLNVEEIIKRFVAKFSLDATEKPIEAVIFDMDGVISNTEPLHFFAFKQVFDGYLKWRERIFGEPFIEFTHEEYSTHAAGKTSVEVIKSFLFSRDISIPENDYAMLAAQNGQVLTKEYLNRLEELKQNKNIDLARTEGLVISITKEQRDKYNNLLLKKLKEGKYQKVTPDILAEVSAEVVGDNKNYNRSKVGILNGPMNPITYGHISVALAALLGQKLDAVTITLGGPTPHRPYTLSHSFRLKMTEPALKDELKENSSFIKISSIRNEMYEAFSGMNLNIFGDNMADQQRMLDLAAYIWFFTLNPETKWFYIIGSDRIKVYGEKDEKALLETLDRFNCKVLYFLREGDTENNIFDKSIKSFPWLKKLWERKLFVNNTLPSSTGISATKARKALIAKRMSPREGMIPAGVDGFVGNHKGIREYFKLEFDLQEKEEELQKAFARLDENIEHFYNDWMGLIYKLESFQINLNGKEKVPYQEELINKLKEKYIRELKEKYPQKADKILSASSPLDSKGGIDFRSLPIISQPLNTPRFNTPLSGLDNSAVDPEWAEIHNMLNAGIIPSTQRIKEYVWACCKNKELPKEMNKILGCIADIMRIEEERVLATERELKDLLVLIESGKSMDEPELALYSINIHSKDTSFPQN